MSDSESEEDDCVKNIPVTSPIVSITLYYIYICLYIV